MADIHYHVTLLSPSAHIFGVHISIFHPNAEGQRLSMPAWIPGSYMIRDFARNIVLIQAATTGQSLKIAKLNKHTWLLPVCDGPLYIDYQVYAWDLSVRSAHFDTTHAYFNGTSLFLRVHGHEHKPCLVELLTPQDEQHYSCWKVATTLTPVCVNPQGFGRYTAFDYADLIDHPVEISPFSETDFEVRGIPHKIVLYGRQRADLSRLGGDLQQICEQHARLFGNLPVDYYLFLIMAVNEGHGGLEHRDSCSLLCSRNDLPRIDMVEKTEEYIRFLGLCSHEYFHLWHVKRICPEVFRQQSLMQEVYTRLLWVFEGITSYYDDLALVRSGLIDTKCYLGLLAQTITRVMRGAGRFKQSLADSSFDAWIKFYKQDENAPNAIVSYYAKGALVALALDLILRIKTEGRCNLDEVMRALWRQYLETGTGIAEDGLEQLTQEVSGLDLRNFFDQAIRGTEDLPLATLLREMGIELRMRPARDSKDQGGMVDEPSVVSAKNVLGIRLQPGTEAVISHVLDEGAAQRSGLASGDFIIAINGLRVNSANLEQLLNQGPSEEPLQMHLFRRDELLSFDVLPLSAPADTCELRLISDADAVSQLRRIQWLCPGL